MGNRHSVINGIIVAVALAFAIGTIFKRPKDQLTVLLEKNDVSLRDLNRILNINFCKIGYILQISLNDHNKVNYFIPAQQKIKSIYDANEIESCDVTQSHLRHKYF